MDMPANSVTLHGTQDWTEAGFWFRTGAHDHSLRLACRLGGYAALSSGIAHFAAISCVRSAGPPKGESFVFGSEPAQIGQSPGDWIVPVLIVSGLLLGFWALVKARRQRTAL
jgi:hypothetical protein